jgi:hypothetical protein
VPGAGIIFTPLAEDEFARPLGPGYRRMTEVSAAGRVGTADEAACVAALMMGHGPDFQLT